MRGYRQFTDEDVIKVAKLHAQGFEKKDIALSTKLPGHVVWYILYKKLLVTRGVRSRQAVIKKERKLDDRTINRIIVLTNFGYHPREIAEDQQVPEPLVRQIIENAMEKKKLKKKVENC